jgi:hypothetical protein
LLAKHRAGQQQQQQPQQQPQQQRQDREPSEEVDTSAKPRPEQRDQRRAARSLQAGVENDSTLFHFREKYTVPKTMHDCIVNNEM